MVGIIGYRILPINEKKEDAPGGESFFCMEYEAYAFTTKVAEPYAFSGLPFSSYSVVYRTWKGIRSTVRGMTALR